jgi:hypothetical protein
LLKRVFAIDTEHCQNSSGELKTIAATLEAPVIEKILTASGPASGAGKPAAPGAFRTGAERPDRQGKHVHNPLIDPCGRIHRHLMGRRRRQRGQ